MRHNSRIHPGSSLCVSNGYGKKTSSLHQRKQGAAETGLTLSCQDSISCASVETSLGEISCREQRRLPEVTVCSSIPSILTLSQRTRCPNGLPRGNRYMRMRDELGTIYVERIPEPFARRPGGASRARDPASCDPTAGTMSQAKCRW